MAKLSKRAFTLMELMVSVALIGVIVVYLYSIVGSLKVSTDSLARHEEKSRFASKLEELIFRDILEIRSDDIILKEGFSKDASTLSFQTNNTLYDFSHPYVSYFLSREGTLLRAESLYELNISDQASKNSAKVLEVASNVERFRVYSDENIRKFLFYIEEEGVEPIYFEVQRVASYSAGKKSTPIADTNLSNNPDAPPAPPSATTPQENMPPQIPSTPSTPSTMPPQIPQTTPPPPPNQSPEDKIESDTPPPPPPAPTPSLPGA